MSESVARAVGAAGGLTITIAGKECSVRPLGIRELTEIERMCLEWYRKNYLHTFSQNLDLLPEDQRITIIRDELERVGRWDIGSLPPKYAHDSNRIVVNDQLKRWLVEEMGFAEDDVQETLKAARIVGTLLDQEAMDGSMYSRLTGVRPPRVKIPYVNWWVTGSYDGMITMVWVCFRHNGVTRDEVADALAGMNAKLTELAAEIERLSSPSPGNG